MSSVKKIEASIVFRRIKQSAIKYNHVDVNMEAALHIINNNIQFNIVYVKSDEYGNFTILDNQGDKVISALVSIKEKINDDFIINKLLDKEVLFSIFDPNDDINYIL